MARHGATRNEPRGDDASSRERDGSFLSFIRRHRVEHEQIEKEQVAVERTLRLIQAQLRARGIEVNDE
jgi:hypothetical protein